MSHLFFLVENYLKHGYMTTHIQSFILTKEKFNKRQAESWIRRHKNYKAIRTDKKPLTYIFTLKEPDEEKYEYTTRQYSEGVTAVIGNNNFSVNYIDGTQETVLWSETF